MYDCYNRQINYLRLSVTDKCNLRCTYCMPPEGMPFIHHDRILSLEQFAEVARVGVSMGITKVRITGGEPLVRRNVVHLVSLLAAIPGIEDLAMTTNGTLLKHHAIELRNAGLHRINVSLDTIDPERFSAITRGGSVDDVLEGIGAAQAAGFTTIKINCVVDDFPPGNEAREVAAFAEKHGCAIRYIKKMDLAAGTFAPIVGGDGGHCERCNRLRVSCDGWVYPCLFNEQKYSINQLGIPEAIKLAVRNKPRQGGTMPETDKTFNRIGG